MGAATPVIFVNFSMVRIPVNSSRALQETEGGEKAFEAEAVARYEPSSASASA
jgi:hypothetical protein